MIGKLRGKYECAKIALTRLPAGEALSLSAVGLTDGNALCYRKAMARSRAHDTVIYMMAR